MKVSHEVPLCFLKESLKWNNYQYVLPHLIDQYSQYKIHMVEYRQNPDSFIICDNGLFEGIDHTIEDLLEKIHFLRPDIFIVPDAWNDSTTTIRSAKHWMINYNKKLHDIGVELMAVCQGKTTSELITTYQMLVDLGYKHIAFNHSSIAYQTEYEGRDILKAQMYGRMNFIKKLVETETIRKSYYHHLLGCSLPQEFMAYGDYKFIKSVDTSNPILVGAEGIKYTDSGIDFKPKGKLAYYFEKDLSGQKEDIIFNVQKFKEYIK